MSVTMNSKGTRVMLIDDSNVIRHCANAFLTATGCVVSVAEDGFDALGKIADFDPDIIFIDAIMPRLDGYTTCSLIKQNSKYKNIPIVMLSARDSLFDRVRGRLAGADDYMSKPFSKEKLMQAVEAYPRQSARNVASLPAMCLSPA